MSRDMEKAVELSGNYPFETDASFTYGTAGFRTSGKFLFPVVYRCALLAALRCKMLRCPAVGLMITASHNPACDNGVKLVDGDGGMLDIRWERYATLLANARSEADLTAALGVVVEENGIDMDAPALVILGRDTRTTSPGLAAAVRKAVCALSGAMVHDFGEVTTPQLHYLVRSYSRGRRTTLATYYSDLASAARFLLGRSPPSTTRTMLVVDCANGIGAKHLAGLWDVLSADGSLPLPTLQLRNTGDGGLNDQCGADFVQKEKRLPEGLSGQFSPSTRFCSLDGDADRIVFFHMPGTSESAATASTDISILDGDRTSVLLAGFVKDQLKALGGYVDLSVGVVQTAYANGGSTHYLSEILGVNVELAKTGVKHLHPKAEAYDIGIYFEANGHGTLLYSEKAWSQISNVLRQPGLPVAARKAAEMLKGVFTLANQAVGDAIADLLLVECILCIKGWDYSQWETLYPERASTMAKVVVKDRSVVLTTADETRVTSPIELQAAIDAAVSQVSSGRSFARASGTEDVVRVYAEAATQKEADWLCGMVVVAVHNHCGGLDPLNLSLIPLAAYIATHPVPPPSGKPYSSPEICPLTGAPAVAVLLAAGQGTRFKSDYPKVIHPFHGKPLAQHAVEGARAAGLEVVVVVGYAADRVTAALGDSMSYVTQEQQLGTGHGVYVATRVLGDGFSGDVLVMYADNPGVDAELIKSMCAHHAENKARYPNKYGGMILTGKLDYCGGYGRIIRGKNGSVIDIVEKKQIDRMADDETRSYPDGSEFSKKQLDETQEFNSGIVFACGRPYFDALATIKAAQTKPAPNLKYEYYATDFVKQIMAAGFRVEGWVIDPKDIGKLEGTNTVEELKELERKLAGSHK
eukprot:Rmarinus@m.940